MRAYKWTFGFYLGEFTACTRSGKCTARCTHWWWPFLDTFGSPVSTGNGCYLLEPAGTRELALWTTQLCTNKRCIISISWMLVRKSKLGNTIAFKDLYLFFFDETMLIVLDVKMTGWVPLRIFRWPRLLRKFIYLLLLYYIKTTSALLKTVLR